MTQPQGEAPRRRGARIWNLTELAGGDEPGAAVAGREQAGAEEFTGERLRRFREGSPLRVAVVERDYFMLSDQDDVWLPQKAEKFDVQRAGELEASAGTWR